MEQAQRHDGEDGLGPSLGRVRPASTLHKQQHGQADAVNSAAEKDPHPAKRPEKQRCLRTGQEEEEGQEIVISLAWVEQGTASRRRQRGAARRKELANHSVSPSGGRTAEEAQDDDL